VSSTVRFEVSTNAANLFMPASRAATRKTDHDDPTRSHPYRVKLVDGVKARHEPALDGAQMRLRDD